MSKGRGSFLSIKTESLEGTSSTSNSSNDAAVKDSGLGSGSPFSLSESKRVGRGKILDDLASMLSKTSVSTGKGRAQLLEAMRMESSKTYAGRAQIFKNIPNKIMVGCEQPENSKISEKLKTDKEQSYSFFNPGNTHGKNGSPINLTCNYIRLYSNPEKGIFVYEVRFNPTVDSDDLRMKYLNEHRDKLGGTKTFDGVTLYLPILLNDRLTTFVSKNSDNKDVEIRILFKRKESLKNCMHLYNVLFDRVMKTLNYVRFDRKQFDPTAPKIIPQAKLEVWPGYVTAIDEFEGGLMLCCDVSHRLLCQKTVLETMIEIYQTNSNKFQENSRKALLGSIVITRYNNRTYRIDEIRFDESPLSTFETRNGSISYIDYYRNNHNIEICDKKQPLLISIKKQRGTVEHTTKDFVFCLIPELCYLTGLRDDMRSDYKLMREIATFTRVSPNQRLHALEKFYTNVNNCPEAVNILKNWGLSLNQSCEQFTGRQMEEEQIYFAKNCVNAGINADFSKCATSNEMLDVVHLYNWLIIHCKNDTRYATSFLELMQRNAPLLGMQIQKPKIFVLSNDRTDTYVQALRNNIHKDLQIVVCICPTSRDDRYNAIKKICCTEIPIPSQVINARTLSNETKNRSIVQKISLQMNCKLGGSLWAVKIPFKNKHIMICGIDSYHDADQKENSVAAFVASLNRNYTNWYSKAIIQSRREELVNGLCSSFIAALNAYKKVNGVLPDNVIIYRDGVGDGQLKLCANYEIPQMESTCQKVFTNHKIQITFIVVQKRINTRFFSVKNNLFENPLPGTVVDDNITRKNLYDFFLVSQSVRQGTVSPTHYVVLKDDVNYKPDILQKLSYKLCFLYYNWPGTIRIPACCQYAHKMAYLIGQSVRRTPSEELSYKLFYL